MFILHFIRVHILITYLLVKGSFWYILPKHEKFAYVFGLKISFPVKIFLLFIDYERQDASWRLLLLFFTNKVALTAYNSLLLLTVLQIRKMPEIENHVIYFTNR